MQGEGLPKYENAPQPPQRKRQSKELQPHDVWPHIQKWPLEDRTKLWAELRENIAAELKSMEATVADLQTRVGAFKEALK